MRAWRGGTIIIRFYAAYALALASAGLAVVQYDADAVLTDERELVVIAAVLDWLKEESQRARAESAVPSSCFRAVDLAQLHVMGHSRGGKLAALLLANGGIQGSRRRIEPPISGGNGAAAGAPARYEFRRALLLDPVDSAFDERFPSAVEALRGKNKTAGASLRRTTVNAHIRREILDGAGEKGGLGAKASHSAEFLRLQRVFII